MLKVVVWLRSKPLGGDSEETLNDSIPSPPQLHIVHYDSDSYNSLSEAAQRPQGLAVLGILIEVSGPHFPSRSLFTPSASLSPILPMAVVGLPPKASQQPC